MEQEVAKPAFGEFGVCEDVDGSVDVLAAVLGGDFARPGAGAAGALSGGFEGEGVGPLAEGDYGGCGGDDLFIGVVAAEGAEEGLGWGEL